MALVAASVLGGCSSDTPAAPPIQPGSPAPDFELAGLDGQMVALSSLRGHPVVLNFWASWCGPCRMEMPFFQQVSQDEDWRAQGLVILAVNMGESPQKVAAFIEENNHSFPVLLDTGTDVAAMYQVSGIPVTYFIDENGIIRDRYPGAFTSLERLDWWLLNMIAADE